MITLQTKKEFIRWVLKHHQLKRKECVWILHYLLNHDENLKNVHFTDEAYYCPRAMVISTTKSIGSPFRFYKGTLMTADPAKTYYDMQNYENEKLYIQLNYPDRNLCPMYASVFEDNLYMENTDIAKGVKQDADQLVIDMEEKLIEWAYDRLINMALDAGDDGAFMYLTGEFKKMKEEMT